MMNTVYVAVGIVINEQDKVLIAQRPAKSHLGGLWEFPGGKLEVGESVFDALKRELKEECDLDILTAMPFHKVSYEAEDKKINLDVWIVENFEGVAKGLEGQPVAWVDRQSLSRYAFPEANQSIIQKLLITELA